MAEIDEQRIREQTLKQVNVAAHWTFLWGTMLGGAVLMLVLMALLGAGGGG